MAQTVTTSGLTALVILKQKLLLYQYESNRGAPVQTRLYLTLTIDDLNAKNEVSFNVGQDGKAYVENGGNITVVYDFGEMPDVFLWGYVIEKLGKEGLFAEVREENCIFISWGLTTDLSISPELRKGQAAYGGYYGEEKNEYVSDV